MASRQKTSFAPNGLHSATIGTSTGDKPWMLLSAVVVPRSPVPLTAYTALLFLPFLSFVFAPFGMVSCATVGCFDEFSLSEHTVLETRYSGGRQNVEMGWFCVCEIQSIFLGFNVENVLL